ncbi:MAG: hypothetical protein PHO02_02425 [Candidatus Nanoarchaeia archaeon]|nr:hypothetical protein [Candidatus Nanoarchaeia archaeon]
MKPKAFLYVVLIVLMSFPALAEEIRHEVKGEGRVAYYGVDSGRLYLEYNPEDMRAIFGEDSFIEVERIGDLKIQYMQGGQLREFGTLSGNITANRIVRFLQIKNGVYNPPTTNTNAFQIRGKEFMIYAANPSMAVISITNGAYIQGSDNAFFGCMQGENIGCELVAVSTPTAGYFRITGWGFLTKGSEYLNAYLNEGFDKMREKREKCLEADPMQCNEQIPIFNMTEITVLGAPGFAIEAKPGEKAQFAEFKLKSEEKLKISAMTGSFSPWLFEGKDFTVNMPLKTMALKNKIIRSSAGAVIQDLGNSLVTVINGAVLITDSVIIYEDCLHNEEHYKDIACLHFDRDNKIIEIKPRAKDMTSYMIVQIPEGYEKVFVDPFDTSANEPQPSFVELMKPEVSTKLRFYAKDIIPSEGGNWFDLGISFEAYVLPKDAVATGQEPLNFYDRLECKNPFTTRDCYLNGRQVQGFTATRQNYRCASDSDCGTGRVCKMKLCVKQAQCKELAEYSQGSGAAYKFLFVSDEYDTESEFKDEIKGIMEGRDGFKGILDVPPFAENQAKFKYYMLDGGRMPMQAEGIPAIKYYITVLELCPSVDNSIIISQKEFGSNSYAVSQSNLHSVYDGKSMTFVHEFGHLFGDLKDEYWNGGNNDGSGVPNCLPYDCEGRANCVDAKTLWGIELANKAKNSGWTGCGGSCGDTCKNLLRPRLNSIMRHQGENEGNTPDGRGDTYSEPALKQLNERIACISAGTPCVL